MTKKKISQPTTKNRKTTKPAAKKKPPGRGAGGKGKSKSGARTKKPVARQVRPVLPDLPALRPGEERERRESLASGKAAIAAALDKKAVEPVLIDVCGRASYADFIAVVSGRSDRQVEAIADGVSQFMKLQGRRVIGQEGSGNGRWTLLDFGEIVIHVFYHPVREFYDLESLWIDAPRVKIAVPPDAILTQPDALYGAL